VGFTPIGVKGMGCQGGVSWVAQNHGSRVSMQPPHPSPRPTHPGCGVRAERNKILTEGILFERLLLGKKDTKEFIINNPGACLNQLNQASWCATGCSASQAASGTTRPLLCSSPIVLPSSLPTGHAPTGVPPPQACCPSSGS